MKPTILIAIRGWEVEGWVNRIRALLPQHPLLHTDRNGIYHGPTEKLADVRYILAWKPLQETIDSVPRPEVIFSLGAGVDHIFGLKRLPDVPVARIVDPDLTGRMTEYVAWQVLHHTRRADEYRHLQRQHRWNEVVQPAARDVTVGIMGMGVMGSAAAEVLRHIGFPVRGWSRSWKGVDGVAMFHGRSELPAFLAGTDILVVLLPLTFDTKGLIDRDLLGRLRRDGPLGGPILINAGRGGLHMEADVIAALQDGTLKAASLDVFETEPLPAQSPLWDLNNVLVTPHVAASSDPNVLCEQIAAQITAFERGEPLQNLVSPEQQY